MTLRRQIIKTLFLAFLVIISVSEGAVKGYKTVFIPENEFQSEFEYQNVGSMVSCGAKCTVKGTKAYSYDLEGKVCRLGTPAENTIESQEPVAGHISIYKTMESYTDPKWTEWTEWSACTPSSENHRSRNCIVPDPHVGDSTCEGANAESRACPVLTDGNWGNWSGWSTCSDCGGTSTRTRNCANPAPAHGGADCVGGSSEVKNCQGTIDCRAQYTKLMLVTGGNSDSNYDVEVINLANDGKTCAKPPNYPNRQAHVGMYFDGYPMACGGYITGSNIPRNDCYKYDVQSDSWIFWGNMTRGRSYMSSSLISEDQWWIVGGAPQDSFVTSDLLEAGSPDFVAGSPLPISISEQAMARINDTHVALTGWNPDPTDTVYIYDSVAESFTFVPATLSTTCYSRHMGAVLYPDGSTKLVVAGGRIPSTVDSISATEILDLDTLQWTTGQKLPGNLEIYAGSSVPYQNTFLIVGGQGHSMNHKTIFEWDPNTNGWITRTEQLTTARFRAPAFLVPDDAVDCV